MCPLETPLFRFFNTPCTDLQYTLDWAAEDRCKLYTDKGGD